MIKRAVDLHHLVAKSQRALGMPHREFGPLLGSSLRTAERWASKRSTPSSDQLALLVRHVHAHDPALASELAEALGQTLESLGIVLPTPEVPVAPTPKAPTPPERLVDIVVCAAADALDVPPRTMRLALHAAFASARSLELDVATVEEALAPPAVKSQPAFRAPRTRPRSRTTAR
jgi:hypothetical protein